jgi:hypothetical protein
MSEDRRSFLLQHLSTEPGWKIKRRSDILWEATCNVWDYWVQGATEMKCLEESYQDWTEMQKTYRKDIERAPIATIDRSSDDYLEIEDSPHA